jgi:hypothetical protein
VNNEATIKKEILKEKTLETKKVEPIIKKTIVKVTPTATVAVKKVEESKTAVIHEDIKVIEQNRNTLVLQAEKARTLLEKEVQNTREKIIAEAQKARNIALQAVGR